MNNTSQCDTLQTNYQFEILTIFLIVIIMESDYDIITKYIKNSDIIFFSKICINLLGILIIKKFIIPKYSILNYYSVIIDLSVLITFLFAIYFIIKSQWCNIVNSLELIVIRAFELSKLFH